MCPVWPSSPTPQLQLTIQLQNDVPGGGLLPVKWNNISLTYWVTHLIPCQPCRRRYINKYTCMCMSVTITYRYVHIDINLWIWYKLITTYFANMHMQYQNTETSPFERLHGFHFFFYWTHYVCVVSVWSARGFCWPSRERSISRSV